MDISELVGKTLVYCNKVGNRYLSDAIAFLTTDNKLYYLEHFQDCCEAVYVENIEGDLQNLVDSTILIAYEDSHSAGETETSESGTWTFYNLATNKGYVNIRWLGESNGYYSESVDFHEIELKDSSVFTFEFYIQGYVKNNSYCNGYYDKINWENRNVLSFLKNKEILQHVKFFTQDIYLFGDDGQKYKLNVSENLIKENPPIYSWTANYETLA